MFNKYLNKYFFQYFTFKNCGIIFLLFNHLFSFFQMKKIWKLKKDLQLKIDSNTSLIKEKLEEKSILNSAEFSRRPKGNYQKRTISFQTSLDKALIKACKLKGQSRSLFIETILLQSKELNLKGSL